jgi:hypothetical protein
MSHDYVEVLAECVARVHLIKNDPALTDKQRDAAAKLAAAFNRLPRFPNGGYVGERS